MLGPTCAAYSNPTTASLGFSNLCMHLHWARSYVIQQSLQQSHRNVPSCFLELLFAGLAGRDAICRTTSFVPKRQPRMYNVNNVQCTMYNVNLLFRMLTEPAVASLLQQPGRSKLGGVAQLVEQRTSNPQIRCSSPGLLAALSRGLSRKRLQVSALPRQWIRLFNGLTV